MDAIPALRMGADFVRMIEGAIEGDLEKVWDKGKGSVGRFSGLQISQLNRTEKAVREYFSRDMSPLEFVNVNMGFKHLGDDEGSSGLADRLRSF